MGLYFPKVCWMDSVFFFFDCLFNVFSILRLLLCFLLFRLFSRFPMGERGFIHSRSAPPRTRRMVELWECTSLPLPSWLFCHFVNIICCLYTITLLLQNSIPVAKVYQRIVQGRTNCCSELTYQVYPGISMCRSLSIAIIFSPVLLCHH